MSNSPNKIPYDAAPIVRDVVSGNRQTTVRKKFSHILFIASIFIFNVVISSFFIYYIYNNKNNNNIIINNQIVAESSVSAVAASKAKLSSVLIGAGGQDSNKKSFSETNIPNYAQLLKDTDSNGAGVIVKLDTANKEAYILTCNHVVSGYGKAVFVLLYDSYTPVIATVVGRSTGYDLAVLKITTDQVLGACREATIANSSLITEGDEAIAVGNPLRKGFAVTVGHVSRTNMLANTNGLTIRSIQVDTAANPGNSGGGLFDGNGDLIGIVQSKNTNAGIDNVACAIHSNMASSLANNIIEGRQLQYADLGIEIEIDGVELIQIDGKIYRNEKIVVKNVLESSDAYNKLLNDDQIVAFTYNGKTVQVLNEYTYEEIKFDLRVGDVIEISVLRNGEPTNTPIRITITKLMADY